MEVVVIEGRIVGVDIDVVVILIFIVLLVVFLEFCLMLCFFGVVFS